jgi:succinate dehydrogenase / fumarate reductase cytochrome b subunit
MVILSFNRICIALTYIIAVIGLTLHLSHGIQSTFQTLGLNNDRTLPVISKAGSAAAVIILLGYISIPVIIFLGIMKG